MLLKLDAVRVLQAQATRSYLIPIDVGPGERGWWAEGDHRRAKRSIPRRSLLRHPPQIMHQGLHILSPLAWLAPAARCLLAEARRRGAAIARDVGFRGGGALLGGGDALRREDSQVGGSGSATRALDISTFGYENSSPKGPKPIVLGPSCSIFS